MTIISAWVLRQLVKLPPNLSCKLASQLLALVIYFISLKSQLNPGSFTFIMVTLHGVGSGGSGQGGAYKNEGGNAG